MSNPYLEFVQEDKNRRRSQAQKDLGQEALKNTIAPGSLPESENNPYIEISKEIKDEDNIRKSKADYYGIEKEPDKQAKIQEFSKKYQVAPSFIERNYEDFEKKSSKQKLDEFRIKSPRTSEWMNSEERVGLSHDNLDSLEKSEGIVDGLARRKDIEENSWATEIKQSLDTNYNNIEKSLDYAMWAVGGADPRKVAASIASKNKRIQQRDLDDSQELIDFRQNIQKRVNIGQPAMRAWTGFKDLFRDFNLEKIAEVGGDAGDAYLELSQLLYLTLRKPKLASIQAAKNTINSVAPMITGFAGGVAGAKLGATTLAIGGGLVGNIPGAAAGSVIGGIGGGAAGSYLAASTTGGFIEFGMELEAILSEDFGVNIADERSVEKALRNPDIMKIAVGKARAKALTIGAIEGLSTLLQMKLMKGAFKTPAKTVAGNIVRKGVAAGGVQAIEGIEEGTQELLGGAAKEGGFTPEVFEEAGNEFVYALISGTTTAGVTYLGSKAIGLKDVLNKDPTKALEQVQQVHLKNIEAKNFEGDLNKLGETAKEDKLFQRSPEEYEAMLNETTQGSNIYMQADEWVNHWTEQGENPILKADEVLENGRADLEAAINQGQPIEISIGKYVSKLANEESFSELNKNARFAIDAISSKEGEIATKGMEDVLKNIIDQANKDLEKSEYTKVEAEKVEKVIKNSIDPKIMRPEVRDAYARLMSVKTAAHAKRLGVPAEDLFAARLVQIQGAKSEAEALAEVQRFRKEPSLENVQFQADQVLRAYFRDGEKISPELGNVEEVSIPKISKAQKANQALSNPATLKSTIKEDIELNGATLKASTIKNYIDKIAKRTPKNKEKVNKKKAKALQESAELELGAVKDINKLWESSIPVATKGESEIRFAIGQVDGQLAGIRFDVKDGNIESIETLGALLSTRRSGKPLLASSSSSTPSKVTISQFLEALNQGRKVADSDRPQQNILFQIDEKTGQPISIKEELESELGKELDLDFDESGDQFIPDEFEKDNLIFDEDGEYREGFGDVEYFPTDGLNVFTPTGERRLRAEAAGFDVTTPYFHGSRADIEYFSKATLGESTGAGSAKLAHFFATSPEVASDYANASDDRQGLEITRRADQNEKEFEEFKKDMRGKYGAKWVSKLNESEINKRRLILKERKDIAKLFSRRMKFNYSNEILKYDLDRHIQEIELLENRLKKGTEQYKENQKTIKQMDIAISELKNLIDNTETTTKGENGRNIFLDKDGKEIITSRTPKGGAFISVNSTFDRYEKAINYRKSLLVPATKKRLNQVKKDAKNIQEEISLNNQSEAGQAVYPVYLKTDNPLVVDFNGKPYREVTYRAILERAKQRGFSSVVFKNTYDPAFIGAAKRDELIDVVAMFDPTGIRAPYASFRDFDSTNLLAQDNKTKGPKALIDLNNTEKILIQLIEGAADESSLLHELGHLYLLEMLEDAKFIAAQGPQNMNQAQILSDFEKMKKEFGITGEIDQLEDIPVDAQEKFARSLEAYFMEGKSPSPQLNDVFSKFSAWLKGIYTSIEGLSEKAGQPIKLNDDIREMFDRMFATQEEIEDQRESLGYGEDELSSLVKAYQAIGVKDTKTNKTLEKIINAHQSAKSVAEDIIFQEQLDQVRREKTKEYKAKKNAIKKEVEERLDSSEFYLAIDAIKNKKIEGNDLAGFDNIKFNTKLLKEFLPQVDYERFPNDLKSEKGIDPEAVAEQVGYKDADTLIDAILENPSKSEAIDIAVQAQLDQLFPNFMAASQQAEFAQAAMDAVHNEQQSKVLELELGLMLEQSPAQVKEIFKRLTSGKTLSQEFKNQVSEFLGKTKVRDIRPDKYVNAQKAARRKSWALLLEGRFEEAINQKGIEIYNHELYRQAIAIRKKTDKQLKKSKSLSKQSPEKLAKKMDYDAFKVSQGILSQYGILTESQEEKFQTRNLNKLLKELASSNEVLYAKVQALIENIEDIDPAPYKELSYSEFEEMMDAVEAVQEAAKDDKTITIEGKKIKLEEALLEIKRAFATIPNKVVERGADFENVKMGALSLEASMTRMEHFKDYVDREYKGGNPLDRFFWKPANEAQSKYTTDLLDEYKKFNEVWKEHFVEVVDDQTKIDIGKYFPETQETQKRITRTDLAGILIHTGNESNKRKLILGRKYGELVGDKNNKQLDTSKFDGFIKDMIDQGLIDKNMMDGVQKIWDLLEAYKPKVQAAFKKVNGRNFREIEATPIQTPWGTYRGGYAPAKTDPTLIDAPSSEDVTTKFSENRYSYEQTAQGWKHERVEYNEALDLDFRKIRTHMESMIRYANLEPVVQDLNKMLKNKDFRNHLVQHKHPFLSKRLFDPWLQRFANQRIYNFTGDWKETQKALNFLRKSSSAQLMFANMKNVIENIFEGSAFFLEMSPVDMMKGLKDYARNPKEAVAQIEALDSEMALRLNDDIFEVHEEFKDMALLGDSTIDKAKNISRVTLKHAYIFQRIVQNSMETAAWIGKYNKELARGKTPKEAARETSAMMRKIIGSMRPIDVATVEAGTPIAKAFLMFYSFFLNKGNLFYYSAKKHKLKYYMLAIAAPAIASEIIGRAWRSGGDEDKEFWDEDQDGIVADDMFDIFIWSQASYIAGIFPFVRPVVSLIEGQFTDVPYDDKLNISPIFSMVEDVGGLTKTTKALLNDEEFKARDFKDMMNFLGAFSGVPLGPTVGRGVGYMIDL